MKSLLASFLFRIALITFVSSIAFAQKPELVVQTGHSSAIRSISISPDGRTLASGGDDRTIILWDIATGRQLITLPSYTDAVESLSFSPIGNILASSSNDGTVRLWDGVKGKELHTYSGFGSTHSLTSGTIARFPSNNPT
jgi:WD40 repeat protein